MEKSGSMLASVLFSDAAKSPFGSTNLCSALSASLILQIDSQVSAAYVLPQNSTLKQPGDKG
jgi:hypothetical protein